MIQNWYWCPRCQWTGLLTYTLAMTEDPGWPPVCGTCSDGVGDAILELAPRPGDFAMDLRSDGEGDKAFQKFTTVVNGRRVVIDSLSKLRQVERDSEQAYRNGEGEPVRFRMWNQDSSNRDVNTFGTAGQIGDQTYSSGQQPVKSGKVGIKRHGQSEPEITLGPGMHAPAVGAPE